MNVFYHGTDFESGCNIIRHGFGLKQKSLVWGCSDWQKTFFWTEDTNENGEEGRTQACSSAQIAAAVHHSKKSRVIVLRIEIPDSLMENVLDDDTSENVTLGSVQISSEFLNKEIKAGRINLSYEMPKIYNPEFRMAYLFDLNMDILELSKRDRENKVIAEQIFSHDNGVSSEVLIWNAIDENAPIYRKIKLADKAVCSSCSLAS